MRDRVPSPGRSRRSPGRISARRRRAVTVEQRVDPRQHHPPVPTASTPQDIPGPQPRIAQRIHRNRHLVLGGGGVRTSSSRTRSTKSRRPYLVTKCSADIHARAKFDEFRAVAVRRHRNGDQGLVAELFEEFGLRQPVEVVDQIAPVEHGHHARRAIRTGGAWNGSICTRSPHGSARPLRPRGPRSRSRRRRSRRAARK